MNLDFIKAVSRSLPPCGYIKVIPELLPVAKSTFYADNLGRDAGDLTQLLAEKKMI